MSFVLSSSSSQGPRDYHFPPPQEDHHEDPLSSALHAALSSLSHSNSAPVAPAEIDMGNKDKSRLEIIVDNECLYLKGTGVDVAPARLAGHVALYLTESTSIKEITLQFRGKARLPVPLHESASRNVAPLTYIVCSHEWSFLEGEKKHSHTLKAGRHFFPFQLQIGGSLPSSIFTPTHGGASVQYKLRAHVVRPGFSHNMQTVIPVSIIRSFSPEALEYQQTLEIENTWPEKLMYSILIPHKAWAAGDRLTALVKFCSLTKGARVVSVTSTIHETAKVYARTGFQEHSRVVATAKHAIIGGKAVEIDGSEPVGGRISDPHSPSRLTPSPTREPENDSANDEEIVTQLTLNIPVGVTPSHTLEPINVSHRVRWNIVIANLDGHTSELRCSLPVHLLDYRLLDEARHNTSATRRLLLGGPEVPPEVEEELELPSYNAHVRDRVANMFLPDSATFRVTNPWIHNRISPTILPGNASPSALPPRSRSGGNSPFEAHVLSSHLPQNPSTENSTPLDWVNSELLLSLSNTAPPALNMDPHHRTPPDSHRTPPEPASDSNPPSLPTSRPGSTPSSRRHSRRSSRASSPERALAGVGVPQLPVASAQETYVHSGTTASRNLHGLFSASMKPFTALHSPAWLSRGGTGGGPHPATPNAMSLEQHRAASAPRTMGATDPASGTALLHRAFTEVPDYGVAARGFLGGVPPLESMRGLPSYEEVERSVGEADLVARFGGARLEEEGRVGESLEGVLGTPVGV